VAAQPHYAYGAGSRMCAGSHLANRELYIALSRMILTYKLSQGSDWDERCVHPVQYNECETALAAESRDFYIKLQIRDGMTDMLEELTAQNLEY
jgi:phenylacetate 2-hydroxylase